MRFFLDSANLDEIKTAVSWGIIDGITTNPSLIKKEVDRLKQLGQSIDFRNHIKEILLAAGPNRPVSLEVTATSASQMIAQGRKIYTDFNRYAQNVVVKIPVNTNIGNSDNFEGIKAIKTLSNENIPVNCTLIFTPEQALLAALAGATYVSPFAGRIDDSLRSKARLQFSKFEYFPAEGFAPEGYHRPLDDNGIVSGVDLIGQIAQIFDMHEVSTFILGASLRNPRQIREAAMAGSNIATVPFAVLGKLLDHEKTREGMVKFTSDVVDEYAELLLDRSAPSNSSHSVGKTHVHNPLANIPLVNTMPGINGHAPHQNHGTHRPSTHQNHSGHGGGHHQNHHPQAAVHNIHNLQQHNTYHQPQKQSGHGMHNSSSSSQVHIPSEQNLHVMGIPVINPQMQQSNDTQKNNDDKKSTEFTPIFPFDLK